MKRTAIILFLLLSVVVFLRAGTAGAATTFICTETEIPLIGADGILDQLYGLKNSYGLDNLQRLDDEGALPNDQIWFTSTSYNVNVTVRAKYSSYTQEFGYIPDLNDPGFSDDAFVPLFTVPDGTNGIGLGGPSAPLSIGNANFLWALHPSETPLWTSLPSLNSDGLDHMVTWRLIYEPYTYVIAWEEMPDGDDCDFNDFVVEIQINPVPVPPAILLLGSGLIGLVGLRRKFKK